MSWETFIPILNILHIWFSSYEPVWDRQTNGHTGKMSNAAYRTIM